MSGHGVGHLAPLAVPRAVFGFCREHWDEGEPGILPGEGGPFIEQEEVGLCLCAKEEACGSAGDAVCDHLGKNGAEGRHSRGARDGEDGGGGAGDVEIAEGSAQGDGVAWLELIVHPG